MVRSARFTTLRRRPALFTLALALALLLALVVADRVGPAAAGAATDPEFVPSEDLPAGSAVAFPVDI